MHFFEVYKQLEDKQTVVEKISGREDAERTIQKAIDMRGLLKNDKNVDKFILGIYLFFKAFPKPKKDTKEFLNFLSKEIDYSFEKKTKEKIDNLCQFIKKELFMNDCYSNKNTLYVDINDFLKNNFNK